MIDVRAVVRMGYRVARLLMDVDPGPRAANWEPGTVSTPVECAGCGAVPWVIRWGRIRIGQELDGYYSLAIAEGDPELLCRSCWYLAIGVDDPLSPAPPMTH